MKAGRRVELTCEQCLGGFSRLVGQFNYHHDKHGSRVFCSQRCAGLARRVYKPKAQKRAEKAAYDKQRRDGVLREQILAEKREHHAATYTPEKGVAFRALRKRQGWDHSAYCREYMAPERKAAKVKYDEQIRSGKYGPFAGAHRALVELKKLTCSLIPDKYERAIARGYYERNAQKRRRDAQNQRAAGGSRSGRRAGRGAAQG